MLDAEQIEAFRESNQEALAAAAEYLRRCEKGIPPDRWASVRGQYLVARGIKAHMQIMDWQSSMIADLINALTGSDDGSKATDA